MNIKIVLCFIIIYFLPLASASTMDNVWAAQYSGFIKSGEPLIFENYLIEAKNLDSKKATITVYKDREQIAASDFNINDFKKYDSIGITLLGIKGDYSWISISKLENKDVWRSFSRTILKWGEKYAIENYIIDIDTFGTDSVNLTISNKSITETNVFSNYGFKDYGNLRIAVININRTGFIELEFFTNKVPFIRAEIFTDKEDYFPDETINVTINITGDAVQNVAGIFLESSLPAEIKPDMFSATGIGSKSFYSQITGLPVNSTIAIKAKIETRDYYNNPYVITVSKDVPIMPVVSIVKLVPSDTDEENVPVQLYVYNSGPSNKSIHIHDTVPEELTAEELDWNIELEPKSSANLTYHVKPQKPGRYIFPSASAQWEGRSSLSKKAVMIMHMPYISITKTVINNKSSADVMLVINNTGDRLAQVKVSDKIPDGYSIIRGEAAWSGLLDADESASVSYSLEGNVKVLPAASAEYRDIRGATRQAQSNIVEFKTGDSNENTLSLNVKPSEIMSFMVVSYIAIAVIITGASLTFYLLARKR